MALGEAEQEIEQAPRVLGARVGDLCFGLQERFDAASRDLAERVVLEGGCDMPPQVVAVVLLGALGQLPDIQVGQPQCGEITERARQAQHPTAAVAWSVQQPRLE